MLRLEGMAKRKRATYRIVINNDDLSECFYCLKKCRGVLLFPNGDETWSCNSCALKHGKIKRLKSLLKNYPKSRKSLKKSRFLLVKTEETGYFGAGCGVVT